MTKTGSGRKATKQALYLGSRYVGEEKTPLFLDFPKLCHHGAILADSGAGKSTLVGRIVEEILLKTDARVVVIDTNGDFRKAHIVADRHGEEGAVWEVSKRLTAGIGYSRAQFEERWKRVRMAHLTYAHNSGSTSGVEWNKPLLSWNRLPMQWKMDVLELELSHNPDEVAALRRVTQRFEDETAVNSLISPKTVRRELGSMTTTSTIMNPASEGRVDMKLQMRFQEAEELDIWRQKAEEVDLYTYWCDTPLAGEERTHRSRPQLCTFDVPSISNPTSRNILIAFLLKLLWEAAQKDWEHAVDHPDNDKRVPSFLIVDEAHNFVPAEDPVNPHALRISQSIQRIAAEGRKYGLFLLLATQRPSKVRLGLLSECENICLLRLRSPVERSLAVDTWGLDKKHKDPSPALAEFKMGEGLLCGSWANWEEIPFRGGGRRTKATGGNLPNGWIHERRKRRTRP